MHQVLFNIEFLCPKALQVIPLVLLHFLFDFSQELACALGPIATESGRNFFQIADGRW